MQEPLDKIRATPSSERKGRRLAVKAAVLLVVVLALIEGSAKAAEPTAIRIAVLKFGTVNWELDVVRHHGLDKTKGIDVEVLPLANKQATTVALQGGSADIIVTDWVWVSRQRNAGWTYTFVPYSKSVGALVVPAQSPVHTLADLLGKRTGIAGGPLDKSWLVLRALAERSDGIDLASAAEPAFGAPPLLSEKIRDGELDAVITFWHYAARLEAAGMRRVLNVATAIRRLGLDADPPMLGYVFREDWANEHRETVLAFFHATRAARKILMTSDQEWERLRPLMRVEDDATFRALRDGYRAGIPHAWGAKQITAAARLFTILADVGGEALVGPVPHLAKGTFWPAVRY